MRAVSAWHQIQTNYNYCLDRLQYGIARLPDLQLKRGI